MPDSTDHMSLKQSRARAKTSLGRLGWALTKGASTAFIPAGGLAADVIQTLVDHVRKYREDRVTERLSHFTRALIDGERHADMEAFINQEFDQSDFHAILTTVVTDEEDEKVAIYAQALKALMFDVIPAPYRRHVVRTISALSFAELELARSVYISAHFRFPTYSASPGDVREQVNTLLRQTDALTSLAIRSLVARGMLIEAPRIDASTKKEPQLDYTETDLLKIIVTAAYPPDALVPASIGRSERSALADAFGVYIAYFIEEDTAALILKVSAQLYDNEIGNVKVNPTQLRDRPNARAQLRWFNIVAVCISRSGAPVDALRAMIDLSSRPVAVILLPGATDDLSITRHYTLDLRSTRLDDVPDFVRWVQKTIYEQLQARANQ